MIDRVPPRSFLFAAAAVFLGFFYCTAPALSSEITVSTQAELNAALIGTNDTITVVGRIELTGTLANPARPYALTGVVDEDGDPASAIVAANGARILNVTTSNPYNTSATLTSISNLVFTRAAGGAAVSGNGGAIYIAGGITEGIHNSEFSNHATAYVITGNVGLGSAIYVVDGFIGNLTDTVFDSNHARGAGTLYVVGTFAGNVVNTTFSNNSAENYNAGIGGAGLVVNGNFVGNIEDSLFAYNSATSNRGGAVTIYVSGGGNFTGSIINSEFIGNTNIGANTTSRYGGAIYISGTMSGSITDSLFEDNKVDTAHGGGIFVGGALQGGIENTTFTGNSAVWGGGIAVIGSLNGGIEDSTFENNAVTNQGGAIYATGGITGGITGSEFIGNTATAAGGAIITIGLSGGINDSRFEGNVSGNAGGAITLASSSTLNGGITGSEFINNKAASYGSAIFTSFIIGDIADSTFEGNETLATGTIYVNNTLTGNIIGTTFIDNVATNAAANGTGGAGLVVMGGMTGSIIDSEFDNNVGGSMLGGAVALITGNLIGIVDSTFTNNQLGASTYANIPSRGGAVAVYGNSSGGSITNGISGSVFSNNSIAGALSEGGAVWARSINGITDSSFTGNSAQNGGAIFVTNGISGDIVASEFNDNTATAYGGALHIVAGDLSLINPMFQRNTAETGHGGAIYTSGAVAITVTAGETGLFSGNIASGNANAIAFNGSGGLSVDVAGGGLLDMRDAVTGVNANGAGITIAKTGEGTWALGGATTFTETNPGGATTFSVSGGTLYLYGAGEIDNATAADAEAMVDAATISLAGAESVFTLGGGGAAAILAVGGDNAIHAEGGIVLNDMAVIMAGEAAETSLTLSTAADPVLVNGDIVIAVEEDQSLAIAAIFADGDVDDGRLEKTGGGTLVLESADAARDLTQFAISAGTVTSDQNQSFANLTSAVGTSLVLNGANLTISAGELRGTTSAQDLTKIGDGVLQVNDKMELTGALTIEDGTLGVQIDNISPTIVANSVSFNAEADLKVTGYSGDGTQETSTVIQTNNYIDDDDMPLSWLVDDMDTIPYDFMYGAIDRSSDGTAIIVDRGLYWYHEEFDSTDELYTLAHGTFTLEEGEFFLLDTALNDRDYASQTGWNGTSLTKEGKGTLELLAVSSYSGGTTVAEGTLIASAQNAIGTGTVEIADGATLVFQYDGIVQNYVSGAGDIETRGDLVFDDVMFGHTGEVLVASGRLGLGRGEGLSIFSNAAFTVANGASLYGKGYIADLLVQSGGIVSLGASNDSIDMPDGSAVFEAGSFLTVGGDNRISAGEGIFLDSMTITAGEAAETRLYLSTRVDPVQVNGNVVIAVGEDRSLAIKAVFADGDAGDGRLEKTGDGTLVLEDADAAQDLAQFAISAGTVESNQNQSFANLTSAAGASLILDGADLTVSEGELLGTTFAQDLTKTGDGVLQVTGKAELSGDLTIEGGTLGVFIDNESATITADSVAFLGEADLKVTGYSGSGEQIRSVVIQTQSTIADSDMPSSWSVNDLGDISYDFMYGGIDRSDDGTAIVVELGLYWYHEEFNPDEKLYTQAHGTFTIGEGESFLLDTALNDRDYASLTGWDGTSLTKEGAGTLELLAVSGYSGGTTVAEGTLIASMQNAIGTGAAEIRDGAVLVFDYDGIVRNELTGSGAVETRGELVFDADMSGHAGEVLVATGSLGLGLAAGDLEDQEDAPFVSGAAFTVADGASLYGNGDIGALRVESGGIVSPGYTIGSIQIEGDVVFEDGSFFHVGIDPGNGDSDMLIVAGSADLGGAVVRHIEAGSTDGYPAVGEWVILTAEEGLNGTRFAEEVAEGYLFLNETLVYPDDNTVVLRIERSDLTFGDFAVTHNQRQVAGALDSLSAGDLYGVLVVLPLDTDVPDLLDQFSGEIHSSVRGMLQSADRAFGQTLLRRGAAPADSCGNAFPIWAEMGGFNSRGAGGQGIADARHLGFNATLGVEKCFAGSWLVGGALRYGNSRTWVEDRHSRADIDSVAFGLYGSRTREVGPGALRTGFGASYGFHDIDAKRSIAVPALRQQLKSAYHAHTFQAVADLDYAFDVGDAWQVGPFARGGWNSAWTGAFTEHGGTAALKAHKEHQGNFHHLLGARAMVKIGAYFSLDAEAGWLHTYGADRTSTGFAFVEGGDGFAVHGISVPRDAAQMRAGMIYAVGRRTALRIGYEALLGRNVRSHLGNIAVECVF